MRGGYGSGWRAARRLLLLGIPRCDGWVWGSADAIPSRERFLAWHSSRGMTPGRALLIRLYGSPVCSSTYVCAGITPLKMIVRARKYRLPAAAAASTAACPVPAMSLSCTTYGPTWRLSPDCRPSGISYLVDASSGPLNISSIDCADGSATAGT